MQHSWSMKPYIIQQLRHEIQYIPQTYTNYGTSKSCNVNVSFQTILQDHGFKQLHHACKWSYGRVVFILQKSESTQRKIWTSHSHSPSNLGSRVVARQRGRGWREWGTHVNEARCQDVNEVSREVSRRCAARRDQTTGASITHQCMSVRPSWAPYTWNN